MIGIAFMAIVYLLPHGVLGLWEDLTRLRKRVRIVVVDEKEAR